MSSKNKQYPFDPLEKIYPKLADDLEKPTFVEPDSRSQIKFTPDQARKALENYLSKKKFTLFTDTDVVKEMVVQSIKYTNVQKIALQSFIEKRETFSKHVPYQPGTPVDGKRKGVQADIWQVKPSREPVLFEDDKETIKMPHSEELSQCYGCCKKPGFVICKFCVGKGHTICRGCLEVGHKNGIPCKICKASGRSPCKKCSLTGYQTCKQCKGSGKMKNFTMLNIIWKNRADYIIYNQTKIPNKKLNWSASGEVIYREKANPVLPIKSFKELIAASQRLIDDHKKFLGNDQFKMQMLKVINLPIAEIAYVYKGQTKTFYIIGKEKIYMLEDRSSCQIL